MAFVEIQTKQQIDFCQDLCSQKSMRKACKLAQVSCSEFYQVLQSKYFLTEVFNVQ